MKFENLRNDFDTKDWKESDISQTHKGDGKFFESISRW